SDPIARGLTPVGPPVSLSDGCARATIVHHGNRKRSRPNGGRRIHEHDPDDRIVRWTGACGLRSGKFLDWDTPGPRGVSQVGIRVSDLQSVSERTAPGGKRIARTMIRVADLGCASLTSVARLGSSGRGFLPGCPRRLVWTRLQASDLGTGVRIPTRALSL